MTNFVTSIRVEFLHSVLPAIRRHHGALALYSIVVIVIWRFLCRTSLSFSVDDWWSDEPKIFWKITKTKWDKTQLILMHDCKNKTDKANPTVQNLNSGFIYFQKIYQISNKYAEHQVLTWKFEQKHIPKMGKGVYLNTHNWNPRPTWCAN